MKKLFSLILILVLVMSTALVGCGGATEEKEPADNQQQEGQAGGDDKEPLVVGMATDEGGVNDESFNQSAHRGLKQAEEEFGVKVQVLESKQISDYEPNITKLVKQSKADLSWGIGYAMSDTIQKIADKNPENYFGIVDFSWGEEQPDNVVSVTFKEHEGSFLMGVIAGKMTKSNKVGFIGGKEGFLINKFHYGFRAGVKTVNPDAEVIDVWADSFSDVSKGKVLANDLYGQGIDVIYHAAGGVGKGLFDAATEKGEGYWAIGVDSDQHKLAPDNHLASMIKSVDVAVYNVIKDLNQGTKHGGETITFGIAEGGIKISDSASVNTPQEVLDLANEYAEKIKNGELEIPKTEEEFNAFEVK